MATETIRHVLLYCSFYAVHLGQQNFLIKWLTAPLTKFKVIMIRFIYNSLFSDSGDPSPTPTPAYDKFC